MYLPVPVVPKTTGRPVLALVPAAGSGEHRPPFHQPPSVEL
jgi:hypothetical protein